MVFYENMLALNNITIRCEENQIVGVFGANSAGKSTLMNAMVGEKLSIITSRAQTTRHRIHGILNTPDYQIIFSDFKLG